MTISGEAARRHVNLRRRPDLQVQPQSFRGRRYWVLKDPVALQYFHLRDEEYAILQMLDGRTSLEQLQAGFQSRFGERRVSLPQLQRFLGSLHRRGLLLADGPDQSEFLAERRARQRKRLRWERWSNPLAIRLPGIDPEGGLRRLTPWFGWVFSPSAAVAGLALAVLAILLLAVRADRLSLALAESGQFFTATNLFWLLAEMAVVKVLHEFGHALACHRFGGECHELGVMFLVFTPCLYCDVSDAWFLPNKWRRIFISAAGIYVEGFLFALAAILWRFSEPGLFNSLCLNVVIVCSVGTIVFNGNPLMRFDGYYILADLIEVPNLRQRSQAALVRYLARWLLGLDLPRESAVDERDEGWLACYAAACLVYRVLVLFGIVFFLVRFLKPYRLELLAYGLLAVALSAMLLGPARRGFEFLRNPLMRYRLSGARATAGLAAALLVLGGVGWVPLPCRVRSPVVIEWREAAAVYVPISGSVRESVAVGRRVRPGSMLARLEDPQTQREWQQAIAARDRQAALVRHLETQRGQRVDAADRLPSAREALRDLDERARQTRQYREMLTIAAPIGGQVLAAPAAHEAFGDSGRLPRWSGTPLDPENRGGYLETGTLLCLVGDPAALEAVALVDQADVELVHEGQRVHVRLNQFPGRRLRGIVREIAKIELDQQPRALLASGQLPSGKDAEGAAVPVTTSYQARIALQDDGRPLLGGAPGTCRIAVQPQSLASRLSRFVNRTFRFDL